MSLFEFKQLQQACLHLPDPKVLAGEHAESEISAQLSKKSGAKVRLFRAKRVPQLKGRGRYEIDIILLTRTRLYVLEVKNHSGELVDMGAQWRQTRRTGEQVFYDDMLAHNEKKASALAQYLRDYALPKDFIAQRLLFFRHITLSPRIMDDPRVITHEQIEHLLSENRPRRWAAVSPLLALFKHLLSEERKGATALSKQSYKAIAAHLDALPSWDEVGLYGGRVLRGDAIALNLSNARYSLKFQPAKVGFHCTWTRAKVWGLCKAIAGRPLGYVHTQQGRIALVPSTDELIMHIVGQAQAQNLPLSEVEWFCKG